MDRERISRRGLLSAAGAGLAAGVAGCTSLAPANQTDGPPSPTGADDADAEPIEGTAFTDVYRAVVDSVAAVRVQLAETTSQGTAWQYDDTHLVTNDHVVDGGETISLWFREAGWRAATVVATDVYSDLAVIRPRSAPPNRAPVPLVEAEPPIGTRVVAIGNPFGFSGSVTAGIISGVDRTLPAPSGFSIADAVQTDAAVNPGNSGGPLVTLDQDVVGVINSGGGDNIGFAISAALVDRVVPSLLATGDYDHPYMGIQLTDVTPPIVAANELSVTRGVYVAETLDGGPADGVLRGSTGSTQVNGREVETGGDVIVRFDDVAIPTQQELSAYLALQTSPGETIAVGIIRDGERRTVDLAVGSRPPPG